MLNINEIMSEILVQAETQKENYWIEKIRSQDYKNIHLAIMVEPYLSMIFSRDKTIESRFSQKKIKPYGNVFTNDIVVLKKSGGAICGIFNVSDVLSYEFSSENEILNIKNEYNDKNPMDGYVSNDEIKPTIKGITNEHGQLFGEIADVAFDIFDSDKQKDDGTYIHSYFYVRLNIFNGQYGFNLFKQGIENGAMTLNMTSGNCAGCAFEVAVSEDKELVDGKYEFKNPVAVDDDGNLIKVGTLNDTDEGFVGDYIYSNTADYRVRQQDTSKHSVWIALKKEYGTFGVVMPNATNNYKPNIGDTFTISNIALPKQYILNAEDRLSKFIVENMFENNTEEFSYSIKFSRIYLEQNKDILPHLNENTRLTIS